MLFNSIEFFVFFIAVLLLYYNLPYKFRWILLLIASYYFYMCWEPAYALLILFSTCVDYSSGYFLSKYDSLKTRKKILVVSLCTNLGFLFTFKYFNFFNDSMHYIIRIFDANYTFTPSDLLLPVGISFYTFQSLSYVIDMYRGEIKPERHFGKFALFVSFFPQLVAGPIVRAKHLLPQMKNFDNTFLYSDFINGVSRIIFGLFKKVVIADTIAIYVDSIYTNYQSHSGLSLLIATYLFAFQIYCDFSGYTDIAIGTARMLGYDFDENFNLPYFSKSITEFWRRWHISLSTWLRDYLYIPLGGNKKGKFIQYMNLMITMILGGLWHGASWNFVIWGALNGFFLSVEKMIKFPWRHLRVIGWLRTFLVFNLICFTWIFFRAETYDKAVSIIHSITHIHSLEFSVQSSSIFLTILITLGILLGFEFFIIRRKNLKTMFSEQNEALTISINVIFLLFILLFGISKGSQFIYFQF